MNKENGEQNRNGIQVISRAAQILRSLKEFPDGLSLGQIANKVDLPRSTVQRIVNALQSERLLIANTASNGFRLGPELSALAEAARFDIYDNCKPILDQLTKNTGETSDLSVLREGKMIFVDQVPGSHRLRTISSIGEIFPVSTTANGRSCLAKLPRDEALNIAESEAKQLGKFIDLDKYSKMLDDISQNGLAYDNEEHSDGISAIGFAFSDSFGQLHAISVPVPTSRFSRNRFEIEAAILEAANTIKSSPWAQ